MPTAYAVVTAASREGMAPNSDIIKADRLVCPNSKTLPSCPFVPTRTGTLAILPAARAAFGLATSVMLSTTGLKSKICSSMIFWIVVKLAARTHARGLSCGVQFRALTRVSQLFVEFIPTFRKPARAAVPLSRIAARKEGFCGGAVIIASTDSAPDDSPNRVTLAGFPPKARMLR